MDIRPLTVLVGANNTNKTWAAYALYGLLKFLTWRKPALAGVRSMGTSLMKIQTPAVRERVLRAAAEAVGRMPKGEADTAELDLSRRELVEAVDEPVAFTLFSKQIRELLRLGGELAEEASATLEVPAQEFRKRDAEVSIQLSYAQRSLRMHWTAEEPEIKLSVQLKSSAPAEDLRDRATKMIRAFAQRFLSMRLVLALPSERKALASLYKHFPDRGSLESVFSQPVVDYIDFLATTDALWQTSDKAGMSDALDFLDARILGGSVNFQAEASEQRLVFVPRGGPALPMHATSSMVRSLAGLDLYLRYAARKGDTLLIDEPEMNAHPEAQIGLIELLARLVNSGVRVVLTTHSPYIVDHLNNLMSAQRIASSEDKAEVAKDLKLGSKESFLSADKVAAYLFEGESEGEPVRVTPIHKDSDPADLFDWETFSRATRYLGNLYGTEILPRIYREE
jgi:hypothetical protein